VSSAPGIIARHPGNVLCRDTARSWSGRVAGAVESDAALLERLRAGDESAFETLLSRHDAAMRRVARTFVRTDSAADEVVQDAWLGVLRGLDGFEGRSSLRTWIFQILLNNARTRGQRERRTLPFSSLRRSNQEGRDEPAVDADRFQGRRGEYPGHWARPPAEWDSPEERLAGDAAREVLLSAISKLPERQREVLALRDIQGYTAEDVCNALRLTETNQRVLLHRARSKVRAALERHFDSEAAE
jgi:RNA polymerase sigma-70 factor, ECF subfamily